MTIAEIIAAAKADGVTIKEHSDGMVSVEASGHHESRLDRLGHWRDLYWEARQRLTETSVASEKGR